MSRLWLRPKGGKFPLSRILESVRRRTITLKEEGESYEGFTGLSRTIPSAFLREGGWKPWANRGSRREGRREGLR